jgi:hypothetical protein
MLRHPHPSCLLTATDALSAPTAASSGCFIGVWLLFGTIQGAAMWQHGISTSLLFLAE